MNPHPTTNEPTETAVVFAVFEMICHAGVLIPSTYRRGFSPQPKKKRPADGAAAKTRPPTQPHDGAVAASSAAKTQSASSRFAPHMLSFGRRLAQTAGRPGWPKIAQRKSGNNCTHRSPARLPCGIPGIGEEIEGAIQHAPHPLRQSIRRAFTSARPPQPPRGSARPTPTAGPAP
jgi:hypothetical protein